jgi:hypothetical protein
MYPCEEGELITNQSPATLIFKLSLASTKEYVLAHQQIREGRLLNYTSLLKGGDLLLTIFPSWVTYIGEVHDCSRVSLA